MLDPSVFEKLLNSFTALARSERLFSMDDLEAEGRDRSRYVIDCPPAVSILRSPSELRAFYVLLDFSTATERQLLIPMPGLEPDGAGVYAKVDSLAKLQNPRFTMLPYHRGYLDDPRQKDILFAFWQELSA